MFIKFLVKNYLYIAGGDEGQLPVALQTRQSSSVEQTKGQLHI